MADCATPSMKLVLVALSDHADENGYSYPGIQRIAKRCSMSERTARYQIRALEKSGFLKTDFKRGQSSRYKLILKIDPGNGCPTPRQTMPLSGARIAPKPSVTTKEPLSFRNKWLEGEAPKSKASPEHVERLRQDLRNSIKEDSVSYKVSQVA